MSTFLCRAFQNTNLEPFTRLRMFNFSLFVFRLLTFYLFMFTCEAIIKLSRYKTIVFNKQNKTNKINEYVYYFNGLLTKVFDSNF